jgi:hypothetical protein
MNRQCRDYSQKNVVHPLRRRQGSPAGWYQAAGRRANKPKPAMAAKASEISAL